MSNEPVFDNAFKTMLHRSPKLVIPLVNEVFGRSYPEDCPISQLHDEHETKRGKILDDSVFRLQDKMYHVECQSTDDRNMVVRMIEYDFAIALEQTLASGALYEMNFPESCVIFLRHGEDTPDALTIHVNLPDGTSFDYSTKVMKAQVYTTDEIFEKKLLLLLPYYLMRYQSALEAIAGDDDRSNQLIAECNELRARLESVTLKEGDSLLYEELVELIISVSDYLLETHESLRKKVRMAMGGEVIELMRDRCERLEREAWDRGLAEGREGGLAEGLAEGREGAIAEISAAMAEQGYDQAAIDALISAVGNGKR